MRLLQQLTAAGAILRYHGDFDWPGITIANGILRRTGALPWRYSTADYLAAVPLGIAALEGAPVEAAWDGHLRRAMEGAAVHVEEETSSPASFAILPSALDGHPFCMRELPLAERCLRRLVEPLVIPALEVRPVQRPTGPRTGQRR
jgi:hypothetical protein